MPLLNTHCNGFLLLKTLMPLVLVLLCQPQSITAQDSGSGLASTYSAVYPGMPTTSYGTAWQEYFQINTTTPPLSTIFPSQTAGNQYSGSISVNRPNHPNNTLFFWAVEHSLGSLTATSSTSTSGAGSVVASSGLRPGMSTTIAESSSEAASDAPWIIWLNGGPGSSSIAGFMLENGPYRLQNDGSFQSNAYSWDKLADIIFVDNPVGTGFATSDSEGYVADENQMATDFVGFLSNLVEVFPSLATRPLYVAGESYAGMYIPYISQALLTSSAPPVHLAGIMMDDGTYTSDAVWQYGSVTQVLETFPALIGFDTSVFKVFKQFEHICHLDYNLTYPQASPIPLPILPGPTDPDSYYYSPDGVVAYKAAAKRMAKAKKLLKRSLSLSSSSSSEKRSLNVKNPSARLLTEQETKRETEREKRLDMWTHLIAKDVKKNQPTTRGVSADPGVQSLTGNENSADLDPWYGCDLWDMMWDFATNFSTPWNLPGEIAYETYENVNVYYVPDATFPKSAANIAGGIPEDFFPNSDAIRAAIHAPNVIWQESINYPFGSVDGGQDPSPPPMDFFDDLATLASENGVKIVLVSGNADSLIPHRGTEVFIQNSTFGGIQGFTRKPSTPFYNDDGSFAGIIHQERNWTYVLVDHAAHLIPNSNPETAYVLVRDFVLGDKTTGLVETSSSGAVTVVGGEEESLAGPFLQEPAVVYYGSISTQSSVVYPSATVAAFNAFVTGLQVSG